MNEIPPPHPALLPAGLCDVLPPEAEGQAKSVEIIMDCFAAHGYQRVSPPLLEFEDSLFAGLGAATAEQTFRLMDPASQRMMGLRADTTPQIGRLATTRLAAAPRPLRLAYSGPCLRVRGSQIQPQRQIAQAGIELIGPDAPEADAEIILTAAASLAALGLTNVSFDLTVPRLVPHLLEAVAIADRPALIRALDRKDNAAVARLGGRISPLLLQLLEVRGAAQAAIPALLAIDLPPLAKLQARRLAAAVASIHTQKPDLAVTADGVEFRGYQYHTGIGITVFAPGRQAELGRGGRYLCGDTEPATGITLYPDTIMQSAPELQLRPRIYLPFGTATEAAAMCRSHHYATVAGLSAHAEPLREAARLGCSHIYMQGSIMPLYRSPP